MERLKDVSEWYTPERVEHDERLGQATTTGGYFDYARWTERVCQDHHLQTVVEVGCGAGWMPSVLDITLNYVAGIDADKYILAKARARVPGARFIQHDIRKLRELKLAADLVCSFGVMKHFHLEEWPEILAAALSMGRYGLFTQHVFLDDRASIDMPGCDETSKPCYHDIWVNYTDLKKAVEGAGHRIVELDESFRYDGTMNAPEAMIVTEMVVTTVFDELSVCYDRLPVRKPRKKKA